MTKEQLDRIYQFLQENRQYPSDFQYKNRATNLGSVKDVKERAYRSLHDSFYSQAKPNMDKAEKFFTNIADHKEQLGSFRSFCKMMGYYDKEQPYLALYDGLVNEKNNGWGEKTSALFVKNVYQIHNFPIYKKYRFWKDSPALMEEDRLYLPVDAVIKFIFKHLTGKGKGFSSINNLLFKAGWKNTEVWDDLWYWGFITQRGSKERKVEFNKGKYWSLLSMPKDSFAVKEIENKGEEFCALLNKMRRENGLKIA